jgi:hypothetical protein
MNKPKLRAILSPLLLCAVSFVALPAAADRSTADKAQSAAQEGTFARAGMLYLQAYDETNEPELLKRAGQAFLKLPTASGRAAAAEALRRYLSQPLSAEQQLEGQQLLAQAETAATRTPGKPAAPTGPPTHGTTAPTGPPTHGTPPSPYWPRPAAPAPGTRPPLYPGPGWMYPDGEPPPPKDPERGRMLYADTALLPPANTFTWRSLNLGGHFFGYTVTDNVQLGATTMVPAGAMGIAPEIKIAGPIGDNVNMGVAARGGVMGLFFGDSPVFSLFGGGPMLTVGDSDLQFTVGTVAYGLGLDDEFSFLVYPYAGGSVQVADKVKLNLEFGPVFFGDSYGSVADPGKVWLINYGVRFHGANFFGDVGFALPACEGWFDSVAKYMPLGVPMLMFGYSG